MLQTQPVEHKMNKVLKYSLIVVLIFVSISGLLMLRFWLAQRAKPEQIGVSFSQVQAERYGSNWQQNYTELMDQLGFRHIRVAAYWDRLEPAPGVYDFTQTDYMVDEASKRDAKLTMVIGQKSLRVPECYYPAWLDRNNPDVVHAESLKMLQAVVDHYKDNHTIEAWQLENEFLLKVFGNCPSQNLNSQALQAEYNLVKSLDSSRPIIITQSTQSGFPARLPYGDIFGFSMYRWVWGPVGYFRYPQSGIYNWWKAAIINYYTGADIKIHELQAEAWGKTGNENLSPQEAFTTMNPQLLSDQIEYARQSQIRDFDLWGSEWWYWLKQHGYPQMWDAVKALPDKN
jgi:hypothetical protein